MPKTFASLTLLVGLVNACGESRTPSGGALCCAGADDAGLATCTCQAPGTVSQAGLTSTLTVSGTSCTTKTAFLGVTSTSAGSVVASCDSDAATPEAGSNPQPVDGSADTAADGSNAASEGGDASDASSCLPQPAGIIGWWRGDGSTADFAKGGSAGTWVGTAAYSTAIVGRGFDETGGGYIAVPDHAAIDVSSTLTIVAWVETSAWSGRIVDKITAGGVDGYVLDTYGGRLRMVVGGGWQQSNGPLPSAGTFTHVACTYSGGSPPLVNLYVNGSAVPSSLTYAIPSAIPTNGVSLRIGADSTGANNFGGTINEVILFNRALSAAEITAIYDAGSAGVCKP